MSGGLRGRNEGDVVVDRFVLRARLGQGGGGEVWRAHDRHADTEVALKCPAVDASAGDLRRLLREGEALARVSHPNVVRVREVVLGETPLLVLDLLAAPSLRAALDARLLRVDEVGALALDIAAGLRAAHAVGVAHRDLKPENILLTEGGAVIVDFGLATPVPPTTLQARAPLTATMTTSIHGTPAYLAPEVVEPDVDVDAAAADRYALGVVLLECLLGDNPYRAPTVAQTLARHVERAAPDPAAGRGAGEVSAAFADVVRALLAKDPAARPSLDAVCAAVADASSTPMTPSTSSQSKLSTPTLSTLSPLSPATPATFPAPSPTPAPLRSSAPLPSSAPRAALAVFAVVGAAAALWIVLAPSPRAAIDVAADAPDAASAVDAVDAVNAVDVVVVDAVDAGRAAVDAGAAPLRAARVRADAGVVVDAVAPTGLPAKRTFLQARCAHLACASLAAEAVPTDLVALKRYRADVDACLARCR